MKILMVHGTNIISGGEVISQAIGDAVGETIAYVIPKTGESMIAIARRLNKEMIGQDIVHAHGTRAAIITKLAFLFSLTKKKHPVFIYTIHGIHFAHRDGLRKGLMTIFEYITNRIFRAELVCVGKSDFRLAKMLYLAPRQHIHLIENGIKNSGIPSVPEQATITFYTASRLHYQKDIATLVKAAAFVGDPTIKVVVAGSGPDEKKLKKLSKDMHAEHTISFLGQRNDSAELLAAADVAVLSTRWEGLSLFLLEAMAAGKPIIASDVHGVRDLVEDGENGFLFPVGNGRKLASLMSKLAADKELREKLGRASRERYLASFTLEDMVKKYKKLYADCTHEKA